MNAPFDTIEDYLNGELDDAQRAAFEQEMQHNPALQQAVAEHRELIARLRGVQLRDKVKKNVQPLQSSGSLSFTLNQRMLAVAAALLLLLGAVYFLRQSPSPVVTDKPPIAKTDTPAQVQHPVIANRPENKPDQKNPETQQAQKEVLAADQPTRLACADALASLDGFDYTAMGTSTKDPAIEKQLTAALRYVKAQEPSKAIPLLEGITARNNALYQEDAEWLLALSWLLREPAKGLPLLEKIAQNPQHAYRPDALKLLNRVKH